MRLLPVLAVCLAAVSSTAAMADVKVTERTKHYSVTGSTAAEIARSMSKRGPYSRAHRSRAWATAARDLRFQLDRTYANGRCRLDDADVTMKITYTLPQLQATAKVDRRHRKKWQTMSNLLIKHEKVHGRLYREFAHRTHRALLRLRPERSCRALDKAAMVLVKKMSKEDAERNANFDRRDGRNYRRMNRLFSGS